MVGRKASTLFSYQLAVFRSPSFVFNVTSILLRVYEDICKLWEKPLGSATIECNEEYLADYPFHWEFVALLSWHIYLYYFGGGHEPGYSSAYQSCHR